MHKARILLVLFYYRSIVCVPTTTSSVLLTLPFLNSVNSDKGYPTGKIDCLPTFALFFFITDSDMPIPDLDLKFLRRALV